MSEGKHCFPRCEFFKCAKKTAVNRENHTWCTWADEECNISNCSYAICVKRRLLPNGVCGETVKRKTTEKGPEEMSPPVKLRGKIVKKLGEDEFF
ncbi:MAG: hypothetical protein JSV57_05280 [Candidatus Bathyarchaeota archaeon]|nr:MAG: hypothetical protein JSV57_05280 [Candidatus Bathyarchaeota archaeon]